MDAEERDAPGGLTAEEALRLEAARRAGFRALMLVLDRLRPGAVSALGGSAAAQEEQVRLRQDPSLAFSVADVVDVRPVTIPAEAGATGLPREAIRVTTTFLGLTGTVSPLPPYLAEEIAQEAAQQDEGGRQAEFLDLFHHRALSFFHRATARHDPAAGVLSDQSDAWSRRLLALLGVDAAARRADPGDVPPWRVLRCAAILSERAVTAAGLAACLADLLADELRGPSLSPAGGDGPGEGAGVPEREAPAVEIEQFAAAAPVRPGACVEIEQFVGSWVELAADERTRLGVAASRLGGSLVLGARVFDRAGRFRVVIGPLDAEAYARLSARERVAEIRRLAGALAGDEHDIDVVLRLAPGAAPGFALSSSGTWRLGKNLWLGRQGSETRVTVHADGAVPAPSTAPLRGAAEVRGQAAA
jgi:type VI secretion system protein ImpH